MRGLYFTHPLIYGFASSLSGHVAARLSRFSVISYYYNMYSYVYLCAKHHTRNLCAVIFWLLYNPIMRRSYPGDRFSEGFRFSRRVVTDVKMKRARETPWCGIFWRTGLGIWCKVIVDQDLQKKKNCTIKG